MTLTTWQLVVLLIGGGATWGFSLASAYAFGKVVGIKQCNQIWKDAFKKYR
jgi:hypothetical protein